MMRPEHHCTTFGMLSLVMAQQSFVIATAHILLQFMSITVTNVALYSTIVGHIQAVPNFHMYPSFLKTVWKSKCTEFKQKTCML
jgi:hypothetical protein